MVKIRLQYEPLEDIIQSIDGMHDRAEDYLRHIHRILSMIESGAWKGRGSDAFTREVADVMLPALNKLMNALALLAGGLRSAIDIMRDAEGQGSGLFRGGVDAMGSASAGTGAGAGRSSGVDPYSILPTEDGQLTGVKDAKILFINGINTDGAGHLDGLRQMSEMFGGQPVAGIYNQSNPTFGMVGDLFQAVGDWSEAWTGGRIVDNPAVDSAMEWIRANPDGQMVVHSQGAAVTSAALMNLARQGVDLSQLKVRVLGGAGPVFPGGPSYEFFETDTDPVPVLTRVLNAPLQLIFADRAPRNILDHDFNVWNPIEGHGIDVYKDKIKQLTSSGGASGVW